MKKVLRKILVLVLAAALMEFPGAESGMWTGGAEPVYAGGSLEDCGPNLKTEIGGGTYTLYIEVKDKSNKSNRSMYAYTDNGHDDYPWKGERDAIECLKIGAGVEGIATKAFYNMSNLETIYLPQSLKSIADNAFLGCYAVKNIYYGGTEEQWQLLISGLGVGNDVLKSVKPRCQDLGLMSFDFRGSNGKTKRIDFDFNHVALQNTLATLEYNGVIEAQHYSLSNYYDLNKDGTSDVSAYFYPDEGQSGIIALQGSDLMLDINYITFTDKDMDLVPEDGYYYESLLFIFPAKYSGNRNSCTIDLSAGEKKLTGSTVDYLYTTLETAYYDDTSIGLEFAGGVIQKVDLDKDGANDLECDFSTAGTCTVRKLNTCSIKTDTLTLSLSAAGMSMLDVNEEDYYGSLIFRFAAQKTGSAGASTGASAGLGKDGTPLGAGAAAKTAEKALTALKSEKDPKGSVFSVLQAKASKTTKKSVKLTWKKAKGAKKYVIYANACGKTKKLQKITTTTKTSYTLKKLNKKALKKGTYYKFIVVALNAGNKVVSTSKLVHAATAGGKAGNCKTVTTKTSKKKVTIKKNKTFKLAGKAKAASAKQKIKNHRTAVCYESTNPKVASVSKKGVVKGVKKGTCYVYAYAQNGVCAKIKVTVK